MLIVGMKSEIANGKVQSHSNMLSKTNWPNMEISGMYSWHAMQEILYDRH